MAMTSRNGPRNIAFWVVGCLATTQAFAQPEPAGVADAAKHQDWSAVRAALEDVDDGGNNLNAPLGDGATALHWAVYWDDLTTTRLLLAAGATVGAANDLGVTPLWLACNNGSAAMVETLVTAGADPGAALPSGETPLMTASRTGSADAVRSLLAHGADVTARENEHGQTALMWAVAQRHAGVVRGFSSTAPESMIVRPAIRRWSTRRETPTPVVSTISNRADIHRCSSPRARVVSSRPDCSLRPAPT